MAGLQCHKRLYLECFHRNLADPVDEQQQAIFDTGSRVGELARDMWPGGVLITEDHLHHRDAIESTIRALSDPTVSSVFESAFLYDDIRMRADIINRVGEDLYDIVEVINSKDTAAGAQPAQDSSGVTTPTKGRVDVCAVSSDVKRLHDFSRHHRHVSAG